MEGDGGDSETHDLERDGTMIDGGTGAPSSPPTHLWGSMQEPQKLDQWVFMRESVGTIGNTTTGGQEMHVRGNGKVTYGPLSDS